MRFRGEYAPRSTRDLVKIRDYIIEEIRQTRDDLARETGYDLQRHFDYVPERERESDARGAKFVSFAKAEYDEPAALMRENPPKG